MQVASGGIPAPDFFIGHAGDNSGDAVLLNASSSSMKFYTNNTEKARIDASGNLLVGKTVQGIATSGVELTPNDRSAFTKSGGAPILVNRTSNDGEIINLRKDGTTVGSIGTKVSSTYIGTGDTGLLFWNAENAVTPYDTGNTATNGTIDLGVPNYKFKDLYLSGGVYLGGTGAANKLDDYEEGTWTPAIAGWTGGAMVGTYTKIGNTVFYSMQTGFLTGSGSGQLEITGLPFNPNADQASGTVMANMVNFDASTISSNAYSRPGSKILIYQSRDNLGWLALTHAALNSGTSSIFISGTYTTAA